MVSDEIISCNSWKPGAPGASMAEGLPQNKDTRDERSQQVTSVSRYIVEPLNQTVPEALFQK